jgi:hypothetical protein
MKLLPPGLASRTLGSAGSGQDSSQSFPPSFRAGAGSWRPRFPVFGHDYGLTSYNPVFLAAGFSVVVALAFAFSLFSMFYLRLKNPQADIGVWLNISLACLGYIIGILAGLFGVAPPVQSGPKI